MFTKKFNLQTVAIVISIISLLYSVGANMKAREAFVASEMYASMGMINHVRTVSLMTEFDLRDQLDELTLRILDASDVMAKARNPIAIYLSLKEAENTIREVDIEIYKLVDTLNNGGKTE